MDDAFERFAPLSEEEKAAGFNASASNAHDDEVELVSPIPSDAPVPPETHRALGKPSQLWTYRDASGEPLFHVCRFDPGGERKQFVPLTLWCDSSGALHWRWKAPPAPRPLYGLDSLSGRGGAPVLVCEGEKATDAAATIFPTFACVTSMGGWQAATKADWSPLAGRHVTIWPDHDAPGSQYAEAVARLVAPIAASVRIVQVPEHFPAKWDLADQVPPGAVLAAILKAAKPWEPAAGEGFGSFGSGQDKGFSENRWPEPKPVPMAFCQWQPSIRHSCPRPSRPG
jgi:putative DNA primase/helicase